MFVVFAVQSHRVRHRAVGPCRARRAREFVAPPRGSSSSCMAWGTATANLRTKILDFGGFDSSRILILRGGILMSMGNSPGISSQGILVGTILVGRLGVRTRCCAFYSYSWPFSHTPSSAHPLMTGLRNTAEIVLLEISNSMKPCASASPCINQWIEARHSLFEPKTARWVFKPCSANPSSHRHAYQCRSRLPSGLLISPSLSIIIIIIIITTIIIITILSLSLLSLLLLLLLLSLILLLSSLLS